MQIMHESRKKEEGMLPFYLFFLSENMVLQEKQYKLNISKTFE